MNKKFIYAIGCAIGAGLIGFCSSRLDTPLGIAFFTVGGVLLCASAYKAAKKDK